MNSMVVGTGVPEVTMGTGSMDGQKAPEGFSGKWSDMAKDMAAIAKEMGQEPAPTQPESATPPAVVTPTPLPAPASQTVQPQATPTATPAAIVPAVATPEVPEKFRGADGKLDPEKLLKSYSAAEKELGRKANELNQLKSAPTAPPPPAIPANAAQPTVPGNLTPLELQVARDLFNSGAGYTEAQAIATARVQVRLMDAASGLATERAMGEVAQLREAQTETRRVAELQAIAKTYPEVLTPQGYEALVKVREENPWINASPEPWKTATLIHLGQKGMLQGQAGAVSIPTPTGAQPGQPLPVSPAGPVSNPLQLNTPAQIEAHVKTLSKEQESEFWKKAGFKWDVPNTHFKGL